MHIAGRLSPAFLSFTDQSTFIPSASAHSQTAISSLQRSTRIDVYLCCLANMAMMISGADTWVVPGPKIMGRMLVCPNSWCPPPSTR